MAAPLKHINFFGASDRLCDILISDPPPPPAVVGSHTARPSKMARKIMARKIYRRQKMIRMNVLTRPKGLPPPLVSQALRGSVFGDF